MRTIAIIVVILAPCFLVTYLMRDRWDYSAIATAVFVVAGIIAFRLYKKKRNRNTEEEGE